MRWSRSVGYHWTRYYTRCGTDDFERNVTLQSTDLIQVNNFDLLVPFRGLGRTCFDQHSTGIDRNACATMPLANSDEDGRGAQALAPKDGFGLPKEIYISTKNILFNLNHPILLQK